MIFDAVNALGYCMGFFVDVQNTFKFCLFGLLFVFEMYHEHSSGTYKNRVQNFEVVLFYTFIRNRAYVFVFKELDPVVVIGKRFAVFKLMYS